MKYVFEWDPAKATANRNKHGVSFVQALRVFRDPRQISVFDDDTDKMKQNYDFSKGEHGKFYRPDAVYQIPIYLDADVEEAMQVLAERTGQDIGVLVNGWLRKNIDIVQSVQPSHNP